MRHLAALPCVLAIALVAAPGCFTRECEGDSVAFPTDATGTGEFLDDTTWESSAVSSAWLPFPGMRTWTFHIAKWEDEKRPFVSMAGDVSSAQTPDGITKCDPPDCPPSDNWTNGTGNLLEFSQVSPGRFQVTNATCSPFFLRIIARAAPIADSGAADAQSE